MSSAAAATGDASANSATATANSVRRAVRRGSAPGTAQRRTRSRIRLQDDDVRPESVDRADARRSRQNCTNPRVDIVFRARSAIFGNNSMHSPGPARRSARNDVESEMARRAHPMARNRSHPGDLMTHVRPCRRTRPARAPIRPRRRVPAGPRGVAAPALRRVHAQESTPPAAGAPAVAPPAAPKTPAAPGSEPTRRTQAAHRQRSGSRPTPNGKKTVTVERSVAGEPDTEPGARRRNAMCRHRCGRRPRQARQACHSRCLRDRPRVRFVQRFRPQRAASSPGWSSRIVAIVFLSPVLVIALILWYRMRKAGC